MIALARLKTPLVLKPLNWFCIRSSTMASQPNKKVHHQYAHTDPCKDLRWTAKECYQFMYDKPWKAINDYYLDLVNGGSSLAELFGNKDGDAIVGMSDEYTSAINLPDGKSGRWDRVTFKIVVSYHGEYFDGWQKQPGLNTVQGLVEKSIGTFVDDRKAQQLKDKGLPVEGMSVVAGRTDKGVTALNQVSRAFHPNFCAKWRRYLYIFPLEKTENFCSDKSHKCRENEIAEDNPEEKAKDLPDEKDEFDGVKKPTSFSVRRVDQLLRQLEGKLLSYKMFARDTKASRNIGPPTECFVYHARAAEARLSSSNKDHTDGVRVMCIELVANRFLRRMVRVLVATVVREAAAGSEEDVLLKLMEATCRRATAPPAPPDGLCLVDVGYSDYDPLKCFIQ
ncbi:tRNA pseudouridine synthase A [Bienertia sinuspersici]